MIKNIIPTVAALGLLTAPVSSLQADGVVANGELSSGTTLEGKNYDDFIEQVARELIKARQAQEGVKDTKGQRGTKFQPKKMKMKMRKVGAAAGKEAVQEMTGKTLTGENFSEIMADPEVKKTYKRAYKEAVKKHFPNFSRNQK